MNLPSASDDVAISVQHVGVTFKTTFEKRPTLGARLKRAGRSGRAVHTVEAVKDVSFDLKRGNVLGIVGNNGAGKTTLIRAISGIIPPTTGRIEVHGRVNTLLTLGLGFNEQLTGIENVILGGLASGYSRAEIQQRSQEIAAWADLPDNFIEMPVRTYSAGMRARLGFAVAVHLDPDILIVDEALSTGDARFKAKAMAKMDEMLAKAQTMVFVSHALETVTNLCTDAIWLEEGRLLMHADPHTVVNAYVEANRVNPDAVTTRQDF